MTVGGLIQLRVKPAMCFRQKLPFRCKASKGLCTLFRHAARFSAAEIVSYCRSKVRMYALHTLAREFAYGKVDCFASEWYFLTKTHCRLDYELYKTTHRH